MNAGPVLTFETKAVKQLGRRAPRMRMAFLYVTRRRRIAPAFSEGRHGSDVRKRLRRIRHWLRAGVLVTTVATVAGGLQRTPQLETGPGLHSAMPAGAMVVRLAPSGTDVAVMGLIECPEIEGARRVSEGMNSRIVSSDGTTLEHFPRHFSFRITVSLRKTLIEAPSETIMTPDDPQEFLLKLAFKLKVYHGLQTHELPPQSVEIIGMPADVPYDERVFRLSFDVENLPVTDRVVLVVLSPQEEPVTHFAFALL
jgi:hypothetical protein